MRHTWSRRQYTDRSEIEVYVMSGGKRELIANVNASPIIDAESAADLAAGIVNDYKMTQELLADLTGALGTSLPILEDEQETEFVLRQAGNA